MFERYSRTARLAPAIIAGIPALVVLITAVSSTSTVLRAVGALGGAVSLVVVAFVRDRGRHVQRRLWRDWGGAPTTRRLRWQSGAGAETKRLHARVERSIGGTLPDRATENRDPIEADARYDEAVEALRARTRDREQFGLLFEENIQYGWRRNCYGLRPVAATIAALALIGTACVLIFAGGSFPSRAARWTPALVVSALALAWWTLVVTEGWVRSAAELYADKLFEATHVLAAEGSHE